MVVLNKSLIKRPGFTVVNLAAGLVAVVAGLYLLQFFIGFLGVFSDVTLIVTLAWLTALILEPLVEFVRRNLRLERLFSGLLVYLFLTILAIIFGYLWLPEISRQITLLSSTLPTYFNLLPGGQKLDTLWGKSFEGLLNLAPGLANSLVSALITLVLSFYFLVDKEQIWQTLINFIPAGFHDEAEFVRKTIDKSFAKYLRVQMIFGLMTWLYTLILMSALRLDFTASASFLAGILTVIPVLGAFLAIIPPFLAALLVSPGLALFVLSAVFVLQQIEYNVLGPKIMGDTFKLHPTIVLLTFLIGYKLLGVWGAIFGLPIISALVIVGGEFLKRRKSPHLE